MDGSKLLFLASQYGILERTAPSLSTLDLLNVALTCKELYARIRASDSVFERLKRVASCDGHGLKARQEFTGLYGLSDDDFRWVPYGGRRPHKDEEIEVRVWNLKCDAANGLPCLRCGVNVCEECRYMPRARETRGSVSRRRAHLEPAYQSHNIFCYCASCDEKVEQSLPLRLSESCNCDTYTRWICLPCKVKEDKPNNEYYRMRTKKIWEVTDEEGEGIMLLHGHQHHRYFWCPCGEKAPTDGNIRCSWCLRKHNRDTWISENPSYIPFFDDDPCCPKAAYDYFDLEENPLGYPDLGYRGPIAP